MPLPIEASKKFNEKPDARLRRAVDKLASDQGVRQCVRHIHRNRQWTNEQHLQLCRVPAPTFFEEKRAEWMAAQFKGLGWDARIDRAGNVVA